MNHMRNDYDYELESMGYYAPGFFHIFINTDKDVTDLNKLKKAPQTVAYFSTFLHEYIHFLQEVTSSFGLLSSGRYIEMIKEVNWDIRNDGKSTFEVPIEFTNKNNIVANSQLQVVTHGEPHEVGYAKYEYYEKEEATVMDKDGLLIRPRRYKVYYYDRSYRLKNFYFGSTCLKEFVAHTIQNAFLPDRTHPDIPYQIAEQIVEKEYSAFGKDRMHLVALCDACLMSLHPADIFFNAIDRMKLAGFIPQTPAEIYQFVFEGLEFVGQNGTHSVNSLLDYMRDFSDGQLQNALQSDVLEDNYRWISHILREGVALRKEVPDFITRLVNPDGTLSQLFFEIFNRLGTPFYTNKNLEGGNVPPGNRRQPRQPYIFLVFSEVLNVYHGARRCRLFDFCNRTPSDTITNEHCTNAPWKRATEENLCPFGQVWKAWGLTGEEPVPRSSML